MSKFRHIIPVLGLLFPSFLVAEAGSLPKVSPSVKITVDAQSTIDTVVICKNESIVLKAVVSLSPPTPVRYDWSHNMTMAELNPEDSITVTAFDEGLYFVAVQIYDESDLINPLDSDTIAVYVAKRPDVTSVHDTICQDNEATLGITTDARYFLWSTGGTTDTINIFPSGDSTCTVQISYYPLRETGFFNNCYAVDSATVIIRTEAGTFFNGDTAGCVGDTLTLTVVNGSVLIDGVPTTSMYIPIYRLGDSVFLVTATDDNGCESDKLITIHGTLTPEAKILAVPLMGNDPDTICKGASILLVASGGNRYEWNTYQKQDSIVVSPRETYTYTVKVYANRVQADCYATGSKTVHVKNCDLVYFPNAISLSSSKPENRIFKPLGIPHSYSQYYLAVYNRWGQLIFETRDFNVGWNGTHQGEFVRLGTYTYFFRLTNKGDVWEKVGTVTVVD